MNPETELPGFERLRAVCQRLSLLMSLSPPSASAPRHTDTLFGEPLDPQLAAFYERLGGATLGSLLLYKPGDGFEDLVPWNQRLRGYDPAHYSSCLLFGQESGFAFYYGTVPKLADTQGRQPIVYLEAMDAQFAIPVASCIDRFFDLYASYLELAAKPPDLAETGIPDSVHFPWDVQHLIVQDVPLIERVRAGDFDFLSNNYRDALEWLRKLRSGPP
jgi:hypothetical protein